MKLLLKNVNIISPGSVHHLTVKDVLISGNKIIAVDEGGKIPVEDAETIEENDLFVSPGWFDLHVNFCDPGEENMEDVVSGSRAAAQGGFTGVLVMPSTKPPISSRPTVEYVLAKSSELAVNIHVAGTISKNSEGVDLS